jgi:hypothetical protein
MLAELVNESIDDYDRKRKAAQEYRAVNVRVVIK